MAKKGYTPEQIINKAWMSVGMGSGYNRASDAAKEALASPFHKRLDFTRLL